ncbi:MAG: hypothetical protein QMC67_10290 [Candidatus Wallbacteria bacterium]
MNKDRIKMDINDLIQKIYEDSKNSKDIKNELVKTADKLNDHIITILQGTLKKSLEEFIKSDSLKELNEKYNDYTLEEKCDWLTRNAILKSCVSGAAAATGMTALVPALLSGAGTLTAVPAEISIQLAEIAYLLKTQFNLILQIAYINGVKFDENNKEDVLKLISIGYGVKLSGKLRDVLIKEILPKLVSKIIKREIIALPPLINLLTLPTYNAISTYYVGLVSKNMFIKKEVFEINIETVFEYLNKMAKKDITISFSDYNK